MVALAKCYLQHCCTHFNYLYFNAFLEKKLYNHTFLLGTFSSHWVFAFIYLYFFKHTFYCMCATQNRYFIHKWKKLKRKLPFIPCRFTEKCYTVLEYIGLSLKWLIWFNRIFMIQKYLWYWFLGIDEYSRVE